MCRENVENVLSGTKAGFKATPNLVFNQKAERSTMNRQKSRRIVENVLSGTKAGFKAILNFEHVIERKKMDHQKSKSTFSATLLALILGLIVLWTGLAAVAAEKKYVTDPTTGKVVVAPEYGGTFTSVITNDPPSADVWFTQNSNDSVFGVVERLAIGDWGMDRSVFDFQTQALPLSNMKGLLAESWEEPDPLTIIFNIRQGVHWHDKPPMNGRELTADDIEYNWHRLLGLGKFSEDGPSPSYPFQAKFESVTATDDWTVVFKLEEPARSGLSDILLNSYSNIYPPEVIEEHGDVQDWRNLVGTGPFMLTAWVEESSLTYVKNPDYWGFDEKYPENRLPYLDEARALIMKEEATRIAAVRTGVVDHLGWSGTSYIVAIDAAERLKETNPELVYWPFSWRSETGAVFETQQPPFDDIRVRHAMQMALDLETTNNTYFKGYAYWKPAGLIGGVLYRTPFEEWPEEVKQYWTYDPEGAEALLDEAGYPRGADGIRFKTTLEVWDGRDIGYFELQTAYWREIGIEVEVRPLAGATYVSRLQGHLYEGLMGNEMDIDYADPLGFLKGSLYTGATYNRPGVSDPALDAMIDAAAVMFDMEEYIRANKEIDMYVIKKHWYLWGPKVPYFQVMQPWVVGYNGEYDLGSMYKGNNTFARLWIDSALKKEMGY